MPLSPSDIQPRGVALEVRLYAEDPAAGFLPTSGRVLELIWPQHPGVRIDAGIAKGQEVGVHYDPLLAKLIAWADTREGARRRLLLALRDTVVVGVTTNQAFLIDLLESEPFRAGQTFTHTVEPWADQWKTGPVQTEVPVVALLAAALARRREAVVERGGEGTGGDPHNPWQVRDSWRL